MNDKNQVPKSQELNENELDTVSGGALHPGSLVALESLLDVEKNSTSTINGGFSFTKNDGTTVTVSTADGSPIIIKGT